MTDFDVLLLERLVALAVRYWLTCPESEVHAAWIPSQAAVIVAHRCDADRIAA